MNSQQEEQSCCFVEVRRKEGADESARQAPDEVEAYISSIAPCNCGKAIKELSAVLPLRLSEKDATTTSTSSSSDDICLGHLKRVRRPNVFVSPGDMEGVEEANKSAEHSADNTGDTSSNQPPQGRRKRRRLSNTNSSNGSRENVEQRDRPSFIEIVVGTTIRVDSILGYTGKDAPALTIKSNLQRIIDQYEVTLERRYLPGRPAKSQSELDEWNSRNCPAYKGTGWWPTVFFNKRTEEYKEEERGLSDDEVRQMKAGMKAAIADGQAFKAMLAKKRTEEETTNTSPVEESQCNKITAVGVAIVDPGTGDLVSSACEERKLQQRQLTALAAGAENGHSTASAFMPDEVNPLCSSVILAIQSVSRTERKAATGKGMDSDDFKHGQYLCTG